MEYTGSLLTSEVKLRRARLVLGWGTAREDLRVLSALRTAHSSPAIPAPSLVTDSATPHDKGSERAGAPKQRPAHGCVRLHNPLCAAFDEPGESVRPFMMLTPTQPSLTAIPRRMHRISSDLRS